MNDPATGAPTISGTAQVGQTLTASTTGIMDSDGLPSSFTYQWMQVLRRNRLTVRGDIGSGSSTYTLTSVKRGRRSQVEVSFTDDDNNSEGPLVSGAYPSSGTVVAAPVLNTPPTASNGTVTTNEDTDYTFAATDFGFSDSNGDALSSVKITGLPASGKGDADAGRHGDRLGRPDADSHRE